MIKKSFFLAFTMIALIMLSGCPDKDKSKQEDTEQVPNTMEKASAELEQIITLLGGPMFDSRDKIEQLKNEQMQMLTAKASEKPEQSTTGTDKTAQNQEEGGAEKKGGQEGEEQAQGQEGGTGDKQAQGQEGGTGDKQAQGQESGSEQEKKAQPEQGGSEEDNQAGGEGNKKSGSEESQKSGGEESQKSGGEESQKSGGEESQKSGGEESQKSGGEESQKESSGKEQETQKPSSPEEAEKPFQFEDSLFGIPQWNEENWKMIKVLADGMYFTWNNLQPQLLEKGISEAQGESFSTSLENLSKAAKDKTIAAAQTSSFELSKALADFFSYYKTDIPPELQRIKSQVTGIHFSVRQNDWDKAQDLSNQLQQDFIKVKTGVKDNKTEAIRMLEISLDDLRSAVQKQDVVLVMIRTNLVTANIEELTTELSQNKEEES